MISLYSRLKCFKQNNLCYHVQRRRLAPLFDISHQLKISTKNDIIAMQRQNAGRSQNTYPKAKKPDNVRLLFAFSGILSRKKGWTMLYKDWLVDWLINYVKPSTKDKTYSRYADVVYQHLIPKLGDRNDLRAFHIYAIIPPPYRPARSEQQQAPLGCGRSVSCRTASGNT